MDRNTRIRDAQNRVIDFFTTTPEKALSTDYATATITDGLTSKFTQGKHNAVMDLPEIMGGDAAGPTPGFFARAAIAGCVSMGIKMAAVNDGFVFDTVTVDIETDFDDSAIFGLGAASAAPLETRLAIRIKSNIPESEVSAIVEKALGMDPWFLALRDAQSVRFKIVMNE